MSTTTEPTSPFPAPPSPDDLQHVIDAELSLGARLGYVALLLAALGMTTVAGSLWLTEPALPLRTQIAFAGMVGIGIAWVVFAGWVLTHRRVLLARHGIVAGRMAVAFTTVFVVGAAALAATTARPAAYWATVVGLIMLAAAVLVLRRAHRIFDRLMDRRRMLETDLGATLR